MTNEPPANAGPLENREPPSNALFDEQLDKVKAALSVPSVPAPVPEAPRANRRARRAAGALLRRTAGDAAALSAEDHRAILAAQRGQRLGGRRRAR
jgi:hypothetical protein